MPGAVLSAVCPTVDKTGQDPGPEAVCVSVGQGKEFVFGFVFCFLLVYFD